MVGVFAACRLDVAIVMVLPVPFGCKTLFITPGVLIDHAEMLASAAVTFSEKSSVIEFCPGLDAVNVGGCPSVIERDAACVMGLLVFVPSPAARLSKYNPCAAS